VIDPSRPLQPNIRGREQCTSTTPVTDPHRYGVAVGTARPPEYPAWKDVTIRRLLNMTSGIPNYSETEWMSRAWANEPMRAFTLKELADAAYPSATNQLPVTKGYHYSNTNYILPAMIVEKVSAKSFCDLVHELVIEPHGLTSTFYEASTYPESVIERLAHGYFENEACSDYHPNARNRGTFRSSDATRARAAPPGCNRPAAPSPALAMSIAGCAPFSAGTWFHRSSNKNGLSLSRQRQES
jgi:CubicO group peptidase (beta-lactamase class C family)